MKKITTLLEKIIPIKDSSLISFLKFSNELFLILSLISIIGATGYSFYEGNNMANYTKERNINLKEGKKLLESYKNEVLKNFQTGDYGEKDIAELDLYQIDQAGYNSTQDAMHEILGEYFDMPSTYNEIDEVLESDIFFEMIDEGWFDSYMWTFGYWTLLGVFVGFPFCILYYKINRIKLNKLSE
ncbi:hypothetical protein N9P55_01415 [bacterium]|nr:hypothetical protein [bacterium]